MDRHLTLKTAVENHARRVQWWVGHAVVALGDGGRKSPVVLNRLPISLAGYDAGHERVLVESRLMVSHIDDSVDCFYRWPRSGPFTGLAPNLGCKTWLHRRRQAAVTLRLNMSSSAMLHLRGGGGSIHHIHFAIGILRLGGDCRGGRPLREM